MTEQSPLLDPSSATPGLAASEALDYQSLDNEIERTPDIDEYQLSPAKLNIVLFSIYTCTFLNALDSTIVATLLTVIATELNNLPLMSWVATSFLLSCAAFQPLFGKISDIFGRRKVFLTCLFLFVSGCFSCGVTNNFYVFVASRFISGIGGGGISTVGTIAMSDIIPLKERGVYQGYANICYGLGAASGGIVAGFFQQTFGWRMAFLIQIPLCAFGGACIYMYLELPKGSPGLGVQHGDIWSKAKKIDYVGSIILVSSLTLFMLAASIAGDAGATPEDALNQPVFYSFVVLSLVGLVGFYYYELNIAVEPVIPMTLLKVRTVIFSSLNCWFMSMSMYTNLYFGPLYWLSVKNLDETKSGLRLVSNFVGVSLGSVFAGLYMRKYGKYYKLAFFSGIFTVFGIILLCAMNQGSSDWYEMCLLFAPGFGSAVLITVSLVAMISAVKPEEQALTTSIQYGFRSTGSTLGVSIATFCFQKSLVKALVSNMSKLQIPPGYDVEEIIAGALSNSKYAFIAAPKFAKSAIVDAYDTGCHAAFYFSLTTAILCVVCNLFIQEHRLTRK